MSFNVFISKEYYRDKQFITDEYINCHIRKLQSGDKDKKMPVIGIFKNDGEGSAYIIAECGSGNSIKYFIINNKDIREERSIIKLIDNALKEYPTALLRVFDGYDEYRKVSQEHIFFGMVSSMNDNDKEE